MWCAQAESWTVVSLWSSVVESGRPRVLRPGQETTDLEVGFNEVCSIGFFGMDFNADTDYIFSVQVVVMHHTGANKIFVKADRAAIDHLDLHVVVGVLSLSCHDRRAARNGGTYLMDWSTEPTEQQPDALMALADAAKEEEGEVEVDEEDDVEDRAPEPAPVPVAPAVAFHGRYGLRGGIGGRTTNAVRAPAPMRGSTFRRRNLLMPLAQQLGGPGWRTECRRRFMNAPIGPPPEGPPGHVSRVIAWNAAQSRTSPPVYWSDQCIESQSQAPWPDNIDDVDCARAHSNASPRV